MSDRIIRTKKIQTSDNSGVVFSGDEKASYSSPFNLDDFQDDELITKIAVQEMVDANIVPGDAVIETWSSLNPTNIDVARKHEIDGVFYLFTSLVDANVSEPTLNSTPEPAWSQVIENGSPAVGYQDSWDTITSFANGVIVEFFSSGQNRLYRSLQGSNLNQNPSSSPLYWEEIGIMRGEYPDDQPYDEGDVALNPEDNILYQSNVSGNSFALDYELPGGTWQLIGSGASEIPTLQQVLEAGNISTQPLRLGNELGNITLNHDSENGRGFIRLIVGGEIVSEIVIQSEDEDNPGIVINKRVGIQDAVLDEEAVTFGQANGLYGKISQVYTQANLNEESYGGSWYLNVSVPVGKVPISVMKVQGGITSYLPVNMQSDRQGGFDNNSTQTITIYFI